MIRFIKKDGTERLVEFRSSTLNLLGHAQVEEISLGSECGGHGICGKDRILIAHANRAEMSAVTEVEKEHLTPEEISRGIRLACQCFPQSNVVSNEIRVLLLR